MPWSTRTDTTIDSPSTLGALQSTTCQAGYHSCEGKDVVVQDGFKELIASLPSLDAVARAIRGTHCRYIGASDGGIPGVPASGVSPGMLPCIAKSFRDVQWGYMFRRTRSLNGDEISAG
eukprot:Rmarinus@m.27094